jgi:uncharacterized membrane protein YdjX (TVP38/TMEM64 family)
MKKLLLVVTIAAALAGVLWQFDLGQYLNFEALTRNKGALAAWVAQGPLRAGLVFFALYVACTALSLPGAVILTLAAGALFGVVWGTVIVSFASSLGATLAFLTSRYLARDWVQRRFGPQLSRINQGIATEGAFYLFSMRLVPYIPFFAINLAMGLTPLKTHTFYWVSQAGMLAGTVVYVNAGTQLGQLQSPSDILSWPLASAFILLGLFPWVAKKALTRFSLKGKP